jgi:hypothetical protein
MPDQTPPAGHDELLVGSSGEGLQVGQGGVGRVLGKLAPLRLARPAKKFNAKSYYLPTYRKSLKLCHYRHFLQNFGFFSRNKVEMK